MSATSRVVVRVQTSSIWCSPAGTSTRTSPLGLAGAAGTEVPSIRASQPGNHAIENSAVQGVAALTFPDQLTGVRSDCRTSASPETTRIGRGS